MINVCKRLSSVWGFAFNNSLKLNIGDVSSTVIGPPKVPNGLVEIGFTISRSRSISVFVIVDIIIYK